MSRYLHGGGIPFIAELTVDQIAEERLAPGSPFTRSFAPYNRSERVLRNAITLHYKNAERQRKKTPFKVVFGDNTRAVLNTGREHATSEQTCFDGGPAARPYFWFPVATAKGDLPCEDSLKDLALAMKSPQSAPPPSDIPAAYTYFGQFIAHDLSEMKPSRNPLAPSNFRTHALDLDSLFDCLPPEAKPSATTTKFNGLYLGQTRAGPTPTGNYADLGRAVGGFPCIAATKNDTNLGVAQVTVALIRFHNRICELTKGSTPEEQQILTMRHFQSVVLDDYLPRIIDPCVYKDVREGGRKVLFPKGVVSDFRVPVEFAAACFRFGHLMVRSNYDWNKQQSPTVAKLVRRMCYLGNIGGDKDALREDWEVDWDRFLAADTNPDQFAFSIRSHLNGDLTGLDKKWIDCAMRERLSPPLPNLAELTLLRGRDLALPSGEALRNWLNGILGSSMPISVVKDTLKTVSGVAGGVRSGSLKELTDNTPLWFYILREAEELGNCGRHLGPLGSRIVMETIHCAIESAEGNILTGDSFRVLKDISLANPEKLTLRELVAASKAEL